MKYSSYGHHFLEIKCSIKLEKWQTVDDTEKRKEKTLFFFAKEDRKKGNRLETNFFVCNRRISHLFKRTQK